MALSLGLHQEASKLDAIRVPRRERTSDGGGNVLTLAWYTQRARTLVGGRHRMSAHLMTGVLTVVTCLRMR